MLIIPTIAVDWRELSPDRWIGVIYKDMLSPGALEQFMKHKTTIQILGRDNKAIQFNQVNRDCYKSVPYDDDVLIFIKDKKPFNEEATYF